MKPKIFEKTEKAKSKRITIAPVTRLEGHAKIEIFLDDDGNVKDAYHQVVELRGFERFCIGRPVEDMPQLTSRLCGVCPAAHHLASTKALDVMFNVDPPEAAKKLRELFYSAHMIHSHIAAFYALGGPDFVLGPAEDPAKRNILGVVEAVGLEIGGEVIKHRAYAQKIQEMIGGKATHPVCGLPGGMSKYITKEECKEIEKMAKSCVKFGEFTLGLFDDVVLKNKDYVDLITGDIYTHNTHHMGVVDKKGKMNFYDGDVRVMGPNGKEIEKYKPEDYTDVIAERVEPWSYLKFQYLKKVGWKGFVDGVDSGVVRVAPLSRLNVTNGMATPLAQEAYERFFDVLGKKPVQATLANHWARVIELMYASERLLELAQDPEVTSKDIRTLPTDKPSEGVGIVEAPRGTLIHHYVADERGLIKNLNLIVATTFNQAAICMGVKRAAQKLIKNWQVSSGLLNMIEMTFRAYDPCWACSTHALPGHMPLEAKIYDEDGNLYKTLAKNI